MAIGLVREASRSGPTRRRVPQHRLNVGIVQADRHSITVEELLRVLTLHFLAPETQRPNAVFLIEKWTC